MAIRERFRRVLRMSDSSDTISKTGSNKTSTATTTTSATSTSSSLHKSTTSSGKLARTFTWGRRSKDEAEKKAEKVAAKSSSKHKKTKKMHPSQRPLTLQNLKHQEMLSHFTMTFGASDPDQIESLSFIGVSPCCTRAPSLSIDRADMTDTADTIDSSLADLPSLSLGSDRD
ncbi:hypothetical protein E4U60_007823 [Claviceps pazoutovae]|uniref:Uncharacterized protein n=1 Tax=Claviceps pazoutovae TaxID=1649127 RepID=A0A9P7MES9_9HYPO|nr:hypothetical protein E4U60_007823 [Claviceps pazoutovae]